MKDLFYTVTDGSTTVQGYTCIIQNHLEVEICSLQLSLKRLIIV